MSCRVSAEITTKSIKSKVLCQAVIDLELEELLAEESKPLWEQLLQEPVVFQAPDKGMADFVKVKGKKEHAHPRARCDAHKKHPS